MAGNSCPACSRTQQEGSMKKLTVTMAVPPVTAGDLLPSINLTTFSVTTALVKTASFSTLLERVCWIFSPNKVSLESEKSFCPYFKQEVPSFSRILVHLIWEINADILPMKCYIIDITSFTGTSMSGSLSAPLSNNDFHTNLVGKLVVRWLLGSLLVLHALLLEMSYPKKFSWTCL